jgi:hypothetical protein
VKPWKAPVSIVEQLWYGGFIGHDGNRIALCDEIAALLPPLPRIQALPCREIVDPGSPQLRHDIAVLLGSLSAFPCTISHGYWVAPRQFRTINRRLRKPDHSATTARSELRTGRLRWLHYLLLVAGLAMPVNGRLQPMPTAWSWLSMAPQQQLENLTTAIHEDLGARSRLWDRFRFPAVTQAEWNSLLRELNILSENQPCSVQQLIRRMRLLCPMLTAVTILKLLRGPLTWLDSISISADGKHLTRLANSNNGPQPCQITILPDVLEIVLSPYPEPRALAEIAAWAGVEPDHIIIDAGSVRASHLTATQLVDQLSCLLGGTLPAAASSQIGCWLNHSAHLKLDVLPVIIATDPADIIRLRRDRVVRRHLAGTLNPHQIAVHPDSLAELERLLVRRGLLPRFALSKTLSQMAEDPGAAVYTYLAMRVYQMLGEAIAMPVPVPGAISDSYRARLSSTQVSQLEQMVQTVKEGLQDLWRKSHQEVLQKSSDYAPTVDLPRIQTAVEEAYRCGQRIEIEYYSPYQDKITRRGITPLLTLRWEDNVGYIDAWCSLDQAVRTFRLDRIMSIVSSSAQNGNDDSST